jgi:hypothetical protein
MSERQPGYFSGVCPKCNRPLNSAGTCSGCDDYYSNENYVFATERLQAPQPDPQPNNLPAVWDLVIEDMRSRDQFGRTKYRTALQPFNGRDALRDAFEESLDLIVYLRQMIYERDGK